jgi:hypothetical protein
MQTKSYSQAQKDYILENLEEVDIERHVKFFLNDYFSFKDVGFYFTDIKPYDALKALDPFMLERAREDERRSLIEGGEVVEVDGRLYYSREVRELLAGFEEEELA